ncbi:hypothetical protein, partial [Acidaminococcus fermentans]|uniref:hypothetical protein n=1 Tax=Acidaminococcus fermentans TaxID=905 RepID=UPI003A946C75
FSAQHSFCDIPFFPWHKNQLLLMPQNTTFFSRGETPTFVNYVIAHNTGRLPRKTHGQLLIWRAAGPAAPTGTVYIALVQSQLCWLPLAADR